MRSVCVLLLLVLSGFAGTVRAEVFRFDSANAWQSWQMPNDLVEIDEGGGLRLRKFRL